MRAQLPRLAVTADACSYAAAYDGSVIDAGRAQGVMWDKLDLTMVLAGVSSPPLATLSPSPLIATLMAGGNGVIDEGSGCREQHCHHFSPCPHFPIATIFPSHRQLVPSHRDGGHAFLPTAGRCLLSRSPPSQSH